MAGARLKLTAKVTKNICEAIAIGTPDSAAARYGGISYRTYLLWIQIGREQDEIIEAEGEPDPEKSIYLQFFRKVEEAKSDRAVVWTNTLHTAAAADPKWASYMLSKHHPETYGDQAQKVEITGKDGGPIETKNNVDLDEGTANRILGILDRGRERRDQAASGES